MATAFNNFSKSHLEIVHSEKLVWQIGQFSDQIRFVNELETSFVTKKKIGGQNKWDLFISPNPNGYDLSVKLRICSKFHSTNLSKSMASTKCLFSIQDSLKGMNKIENDVIGQYQYNGGIYEAVWIVPNFVNLNALLDARNGYLPGDQLTIVCKIDFFETKVIKHNLRVPDIQIPNNRVVEDMGILYEKKEFTDCIIQAGNKEFMVHKCILANRSPVFSEMFGHEMVEAQSNKLIIDDIKSDVMEQLLHFIYDGNAPKLEDMAEELLVAADKYQLEQLKIPCEYALAKSLTTENACQRFVFAIFHSAKRLKAQAIDFIKKSTNEIMETDGWKMLNNEQLKMLGFLPITADIDI